MGFGSYDESEQGKFANKKEISGEDMTREIKGDSHNNNGEITASFESITDDSENSGIRRSLKMKKAVARAKSRHERLLKEELDTASEKSTDDNSESILTTLSNL